MSTTKHQVTAYRWGSHRGCDWEEEWKIHFTYTPGTPASHDDPGSGPTVEFDYLEGSADAPPEFAQYAEKLMNDWAEDWLAEHQDEAIAAAIHDREAATDAHADYRRRARIDDALMEKAFIR